MRRVCQRNRSGFFFGKESGNIVLLILIDNNMLLVDWLDGLGIVIGCAWRMRLHISVCVCVWGGRWVCWGFEGGGIMCNPCHIAGENKR